MPLPKITETARLYADVELRFTPQGKAVAVIPLVFNKRKKNSASGEWEDAGSMFVRGTAWDQLGENAAQSLEKGDEVIVTGEMSVREFERSDGSKGQSVELNVYAIGPSLSWTTVKVNKATRSSSSTPAPGPGGDPWPTAAANEDEPPF